MSCREACFWAASPCALVFWEWGSYLLAAEPGAGAKAWLRSEAGAIKLPCER